MAGEKMSISIPRKKGDLKEEHARGPDRRCATEPGENIPSDDGLDLKQQKGTEKNRKSIGDHGQGDRMSKPSRGLRLTLRLYDVPHSCPKCQDATAAVFVNRTVELHSQIEFNVNHVRLAQF